MSFLDTAREHRRHSVRSSNERYRRMVLVTVEAIVPDADADADGDAIRRFD